ncbi:MAG: Wadjet anti-phage system protein JetD domain-containing protein [Nocardioides sp.]|uniref:Wadjet anti-phage system protein JetD domain-containing protein n=1 Tax=Nocardioides sp. TaxID=35761 RepID=UPI003D6AE2B5
MSGQLLSPGEAGVKVAGWITRNWANAVCAEVVGETCQLSLSLRRNLDSGEAVRRHGIEEWGPWRLEWRRLELATEPGEGAWVESRPITVAGQKVDAARFLHVPDLASAEAACAALGGERSMVDLGRARDIARRLHSAGVTLTAGNLKKVTAFSETDLEALLRVLGWLADHPDVSRWSARQLPIPGVHTKWLDKQRTLVRSLTGRDLDSELRERPTAVHLTYVDPVHLARGRRRHDAWTKGDEHDIAYPPETVLVVENRDCRVFFPEMEGTVIVEGSGSAATALVAEIPWVRDAERVVYWGDMDADGYAILDRFRAALPKVRSILMDYVSMNRYEDQGVSEDKDGNPIRPCPTRLSGLEDAERDAYDRIATSGHADFRRIEQEKLPIEDAVAALS